MRALRALVKAPIGFAPNFMPAHPLSNEPEDVAAVAVFLASAESAYVTGQVITVDGGYMATGCPAFDEDGQVPG